MNRKVAIIVFSFCVSIVYFGCIPAKKYTEAFRFNNKCQCDSILIESNQFLIDNDSSLYSNKYPSSSSCIVAKEEGIKKFPFSSIKNG